VQLYASIPIWLEGVLKRIPDADGTDHAYDPKTWKRKINAAQLSAVISTCFVGTHTTSRRASSGEQLGCQ
jgi:hypothetical protein